MHALKCLAIVILQLPILPALGEQAVEKQAVVSAGRQVVTGTIPLGHNQQGWQYQGQGWCHPGDDAAWANTIAGNTATVLLWSGDTSSPMIHAQGAHWRITQLTLQGWPNPAVRDALHKAPRCRAGIHVQQWGRFTGGKAVIEEVGFGGFESAILMGKEGQGGNDNLTVRKVMAHHGGSLLEIAGQQAMSTHVDGWHTRHLDQVVLASGGGDVAFRNGDCNHSSTLLRVTADAREVGSNNGFFLFETIKVDLSRGNAVFTLVDEQPAESGEVDAHVRITVRDLRLPSSRTAVRATLRGSNSRLLIQDAKNLPSDTRFSLHDGAKIVLRDCDLSCDPPELLAKGSAGMIVVRDCWRSGQLIDAEVRVEN